MAHRTIRRDFLKSSAAAGLGYWVAGGVRAAESKSPNEKIQFASIGVGGKGSSDSADAFRRGDMVAICDVDQLTLDAKAGAYKVEKKYADYREMLDEMGDKIDAVTISTPDHNHAPAAAIALRKGIHTFVQKPLTHSIHEARVLSELAHEKGLATMMGNQGTAEAGLRKAAATVQAGALGKVTEVHVWTNRPVWPQGEPRRKPQPVPEHVNWELFLGPAPYRPYTTSYHPFKWRGWWDFGTGALGDMACHTVNLPYAALNLRDPISVQATTSGHDKDSYPKWSVIDFEFPGNDQRGPVKFFWYDGGKRPSADLLDGKQVGTSGCVIVGEKGKLYSVNDNGATYELLGVDQPDVEFEKSPGHFDEWVRAIQGGKPAMSNLPDYAGPLTETILLGNLAVWAAAEVNDDGKAVGKKVEWDAKKLAATNAPELAQIVKREYREGYTL